MANDAVQIFLMIGITGSIANPATMHATPVISSVRILLHGVDELSRSRPATTPKMVFAAEEMQLMVAYDAFQFLCRMRRSRYQPTFASFTQGPRMPGPVPNTYRHVCSTRSASATATCVIQLLRSTRNATR